MPKRHRLGISSSFTDGDYINDYFPDLYTDFKNISVYEHPFIYFNFTFFGRSVAIRKVKTGFQVVTRCWFSTRFSDSLLKRSKRSEWHIYYHGYNLLFAKNWFFKLCRELMLISDFDTESFYVPRNMEFF